MSKKDKHELSELKTVPPHFAMFSNLLLNVMDEFAYHYASEAFKREGAALLPAGLDRRTAIFDQLGSAARQLEEGTLSSTMEIDLFNGIQARHAQNPEHQEGHAIIERLYSGLNETIFNRGPKSYYDLENRTRELLDRNRWMIIAGSAPLRFKVPWDEFALKNRSGGVSGLQMKLGPNLFVSFYMPNFSRPSEIVPDNTRVTAYVVPDDKLPLSVE